MEIAVTLASITINEPETSHSGHISIPSNNETHILLSSAPNVDLLGYREQTYFGVSVELFLDGKRRLQLK